MIPQAADLPGSPDRRLGSPVPGDLGDPAFEGRAGIRL